MAESVTVNITVDSSGRSKEGFGIGMYLSQTAAWAERVREYTSLSGVSDDFATTSPEYLAAQAYFAQNPHPKKFKIGRCALPQTKKIEIQVLTAISDHDYTVVVYGEGVTTTTCTYTSDSSATKAEISAGLKALIDAVVGINFTCVDDLTDKLTNTGSAAGDWFSIEVAQANLTELEYYETHTDAGVATDLAAINNEDSDWFFVLNAFNSADVAAAIAAWVDSNNKAFICDLAETEMATTAAGNGDTADAMATAARTNTSNLFHPWLHEMAAPAWVGDVAWKAAGSENWANRTLSGVTAAVLTDTQKANILARNASYYTSINGRNRTWKGQTAAGSGADWMDTVRFKEWLRDTIIRLVDDATSGDDKLAFTDQGGAAIEGAIWAALQMGVANGGLVDDDTLTVFVPKAADISAADKSARKWPGITFAGTLATPVNEATINGTVTV